MDLDAEGSLLFQPKCGSTQMPNALNHLLKYTLVAWSKQYDHGIRTPRLNSQRPPPQSEERSLFSSQTRQRPDGVDLLWVL